MMKTINWYLSLIIIFSLGACDKDSTPGQVLLALNHSVKGDVLETDKFIYNSQAGHTYNVTNLKYYISNISLESKEGSSVLLKDFHLMDIHSPETYQFNISDIPEGTYTSLHYIFGLDAVTNVKNGLPNTVENINMEWPIPGDQGYHYMKFEGRYDSLNTGKIRSFNIHTGAAKNNQNFFKVVFPITESYINGDTWKFTVNMDLNEWLQNPNT
ncbi:MAG: MbnP family protein, partial [Saprospiraceae bacterium]